jgi:tetratricopeptide (TPR) repeat protein
MKALHAVCLITLAVLTPLAAVCAEAGRAASVQDLLDQAAAEKKQGHYTEAAELYDRVIAADPEDPLPRLELINLLAQVAAKEARCRRAIRDALDADVFSDTQWATVADICTEWGFERQAADVYHKLLEMHPENAEYPAKILELLLASDAEPDEVRTELTTLLGDETKPDVALRLARLCESYLHFDDAAWLYEQILAADEKNLEARLRLARVQLRWGKLDEAERHAQRNVELDYEHIESRLLLAEVRLRRGDYDEALKSFRTIGKEEGGHFGAYLGEARAAFAVGEYEDAVSACLKALRLERDSADARALLGELYSYTGRYTKAAAEYARAREADPENVEAMIGAARALADSGKSDEAEQAFYRLYDVYESATTERELTARVLAHVGVACRYTDNPKDALYCFVKATEKDATYIPARLWLGRLFLERHQPSDAAKEFVEILAINPRHTGALVGLAEVAFERAQFSDVQRHCEAALAVNARHVETLELIARMRILDEQYTAAKDALDKALEVNPNSLESLSHLASYYYQLGEMSAFERTMKQVLAINPKYARGYEIVAAACEYRRQNEDALALLRTAIELDEKYAPAWTDLGVILIREGRESEAEDALNTAFKLDSYNHRTLNFSKVLKEIRQGYVVRETDHFIMKWHGDKDFVLDHFLPEICEQVYDEVCAHFGFEPPKKTLIEVFPTHDRFAARIAGVPFIATVGACFGKVFAMDSPRTGGFDWRRVFEHEFTHVVTLQQTNMRIPFWFTEGLAVCWEKGARPMNWDRMTVRAAVLDEVVPLDELSSWFTRPRTMNQKQWAYAQAALTTEYLYSEFGRDAIVAMLGMYRDGKRTAEVIKAVCHVPQADLERRVKTYILGKGHALGASPLFILDDAERLKARIDASPNDAAAHALYAQALTQKLAGATGPDASRLADEAHTHARKAIELGTSMPEPHTALAYLELVAGNADTAARHCRDALALDADDFAAHAYLGDIAAAGKRFDEAVEHYTAALRIYPGHAQIGHKLAAIYEQQGAREKAIAELEHVITVEHQPYATLRKLALLYEKNEDWKNVVRILERALEFNLYDPHVYELLARAYAAREQDTLAERTRTIGADVAYMAATNTHQKAEVHAYLRLALAMDPNHEKALKFIEEIGGLDEEPADEGPPEGQSEEPARDGNAGDDPARP